MGDIDTSSMLIRVGAWLQIPFSLFIIFIIAWVLWLIWPVLIGSGFWLIFGLWIALGLEFGIFTGILGLVLALLWFRWQHDIPTHKSGLIKTGIVGMILTGTVPGLLVLVGAAIYPTK